MTRVREWGLQDRPLNTVHFESPSHTGTLLCGLNTLRSKGLLLDVTLVAEGEAFQAHRVVLASCSDYFRAMFTDAMRESRQSEICLNGVTAAGMRLLLDYAYTSRLALNLANIQDVLSAASHVQVVAVVEACSSYLQTQLDLENCVDIATIAETYSLSQLRRRVYRFMSSHLREFSRTQDFQRLSPMQLEYLLGCDFPVDCPEAEVLRIVIRWLSTLPAPTTADSCVQQRLPYAQRILRRVHFTEITPWDLDTVLSHSHMDQTLYRQVLAETCRQNRPRTLKLPIPSSTSLINSRGMELAVVKVGGFGIAGITNEITYFLPSVSKWRHLTSIPHVEQCNYGTAVLDNELYVVGGCFNQSLQENIHPFGFRYSPRYNKWTTMAPMQRERCRFSLNVVCGRLYAIGGASEVDDPDDEEEVSACECYDPQTDSWESIRPLPGHRSQHAGAAMPGGSLYISGGLDRDLVLSSMLCYDAVTDVWQQRAPMLTPRADHVMLVLGERLYVCGGWFEDADTGNRVLCETIDVYDVSANTWDVVTTVPTPRYHAGIVGVGSKIYFIGGFHSDAMFDRATAAIECYDLETDTWITGEKYPQDIWEHTCVTLYIPRCRDDMEVMATNDSRV
ncbi:kelch-like protein 26 isoform X1 [Schistocerca nitens]|uniref:kelch-like protein 26 isoform X1 n=1 Tax=Schistocerca nitens TaxID=7011 RepID=UPI00211923CE|nr:kelch-like protein 26 isoform X1 [Schistocerca nitens]XP_049790539.1 kelch-like protein 26 isoform X1 [Schistocerca nitens]XP_049790540.1 kelch-like protein 26 isoform X1 [Schistocerca nitens]